jgi:Cu/Ag efflux protein CusF
MKKTVFFLVSLFLLSSASGVFADSKKTEFKTGGEVVSVDPLYGRITLKHKAIQGFAGEGETEFFVSSNELLKGLSKRDLVDFTVIEKRGDTKVTEIKKTGTAPEADNRLLVGKAVQDVLVATGEVAKTVSSPIEPAHQVVSGTVGATTEMTGSVLNDASPEVKKKF